MRGGHVACVRMLKTAHTTGIGSMGVGVHKSSETLDVHASG